MIQKLLFLGGFSLCFIGLGSAVVKKYNSNPSPPVKQKYFVSYSYSRNDGAFGFGNAKLFITTPDCCLSDTLNAVLKRIVKRDVPNTESVCMLNYIKLEN